MYTLGDVKMKFDLCIRNLIRFTGIRYSICNISSAACTRQAASIHVLSRREMKRSNVR